jgi:hypothetical protein
VRPAARRARTRPLDAAGATPTLWDRDAGKFYPLHPCSRRGWRVQRGEASLGKGEARRRLSLPIASLESLVFSRKQDKFSAQPARKPHERPVAAFLAAGRVGHSVRIERAPMAFWRPLWLPFAPVLPFFFLADLFYGLSASADRDGGARERPALPGWSSCTARPWPRLVKSPGRRPAIYREGEPTEGWGNPEGVPRP